MRNQIGLGAIVLLAACSPYVSVGDLGGGSGGSAGTKPKAEVPMAQAGASTAAPTGGAGAGGAGLAGSDEATGGASAGRGGSSGPSAGGGGSGGPSAGTSGSGGGGFNPLEPYAPRSGSFKMLAYSSTRYSGHDGAITAGKALLRQIADEQGFELVTTEENAFLFDLGSFELVFFLNTWGEVFNDEEQRIYEHWMTGGGAFAGTHSATATESGWAFYSEVTGQYYDGHGPAGVTNDLALEPTMLTHPGLKGLPNPWRRTDEWAKFDKYLDWSAKPGFKILMRRPDNDQPVAWLREWGNFRSFYTALGHDAQAFTDPLIKKHLTGGIMWAVRREHLIK